MGKVAFSLGPICFYWYGLIIAAAIVAAFFVVLVQARLTRRPADPVVDLIIVGLPAGIVGARLYFVAANWALYRDNPLDALFLWRGGLAVHGAYIAFLLVLWLYTRRHDLDFWSWADLVAPGLAIGQAIGQWANFVNQEAFGFPTDLPWGVYIDFALRPAGYEQFDFFHPVFLYESAWNAILFLLATLLVFYRCRVRPIPSGCIFLIYIILYAAGHYFFAGMRLEGEAVLGVCLAQLISVLAVAAGLAALFRRSTDRSPAALK